MMPFAFRIERNSLGTATSLEHVLSASYNFFGDVHGRRSVKGSVSPDLDRTCFYSIHPPKSQICARLLGVEQVGLVRMTSHPPPNPKALEQGFKSHTPAI